MRGDASSLGTRSSHAHQKADTPRHHIRPPSPPPPPHTRIVQHISRMPNTSSFQDDPFIVYGRIQRNSTVRSSVWEPCVSVCEYSTRAFWEVGQHGSAEAAATAAAASSTPPPPPPNVMRRTCLASELVLTPGALRMSLASARVQSLLVLVWHVVQLQKYLPIPTPANRYTNDAANDRIRGTRRRGGDAWCSVSLCVRARM